MLTENDIVESVSLNLENEGYQILQRLTADERGVDIIAIKGEKKLYDEAKGETSSKSYTNRFGKPFTKNQIKSHVSRAILTSLHILSTKKQIEKFDVAIALPYTEAHRELIDSIFYGLQKIDIQVFWVNKTQVIKN